MRIKIQNDCKLKSIGNKNLYYFSKLRITLSLTHTLLSLKLNCFQKSFSVNKIQKNSLTSKSNSCRICYDSTNERIETSKRHLLKVLKALSCFNSIRKQSDNESVIDSIESFRLHRFISSYFPRCSFRRCWFRFKDVSRSF